MFVIYYINCSSSFPFLLLSHLLFLSRTETLSEMKSKHHPTSSSSFSQLASFISSIYSFLSFCCWFPSSLRAIDKGLGIFPSLNINVGVMIIPSFHHDYYWICLLFDVCFHSFHIFFFFNSLSLPSFPLSPSFSSSDKKLVDHKQENHCHRSLAPFHKLH